MDCLLFGDQCGLVIILAAAAEPILKVVFNFFLEQTSIDAFFKHAIYSILSSLLLLPLSKLTLVFLCLSSHYYPGLGFHYALVPLEVFVGHVQTISTSVEQAFSC